MNGNALSNCQSGDVHIGGGITMKSNAANSRFSIAGSGFILGKVNANFGTAGGTVELKAFGDVGRLQFVQTVLIGGAQATAPVNVDVYRASFSAAAKFLTGAGADNLNFDDVTSF